MRQTYLKLVEFLDQKIVLVIDPTTNYKESVRRFLQNLKVKNVKVVSTIKEAKRVMLTEKVGLFIVEWNIEGTNGLQFCKDLKTDQRYQNTPFLLISSENLRQDVILASEGKIDGYLLKPFSYDEFCDQIDKMVNDKTNKSPFQQLIIQAEECLQCRQFDQAEKYFGDVLLISNQSARAFCGLAKISEQRKNVQQALELYQQSKQINPDYLEAYKGCLELYQTLNDKEAVVKECQKINELSPGNPKYTLILAKVCLDQGDLDSSEQYFKKSLKLAPKVAEAYRGLGQVYLEKNDNKKALKYFQKALDLDDHDISTLNSFGLAHVRLGNVRKGIETFLLAIKIGGYDGRIFFNLGHAFELQREFSQAVVYYEKALEHNPKLESAERGLKRLLKFKYAS